MPSRLLKYFYEGRRFEEVQFQSIRRNPLQICQYLLKQKYARTRYPRNVRELFLGKTFLGGWQSEGAFRPSLRVIATGDLLWHPLPVDRYIKPRLERWLGRADVLMMNLETIVSDALPHRQARPFYTLSAKSDILKPLARLPSTTEVVLSVANNHCLDHNDEGLRATLKAIRDTGAWPIGITDLGGPASVTLDRKGFKIGISSWTGFVNHPDRIEGSTLSINLARGLVNSRYQDTAKVSEAVSSLRASGAELVLVNLHWGYEYEWLPDPLQLALARGLVHAGADAIIGQHPHVVQPIELLIRGAETKAPSVCLAAYSLGNFISDMERVDWSVGLALELVFGTVPGKGGLFLIESRPQPLFISKSAGQYTVDLLEPERLFAELERSTHAKLDFACDWWDTLKKGDYTGLENILRSYSKMFKPGTA